MRVLLLSKSNIKKCSKTTPLTSKHFYRRALVALLIDDTGNDVSRLTLFFISRAITIKIGDQSIDLKYVLLVKYLFQTEP